AEAHEIFQELYEYDRDEQRYAVHLFVSCQALGYTDQMRAIVDDLDGRRRALYYEALTHLRELNQKANERAMEKNEKPPEDRDAAAKLLNDDEKKELKRWRGA